MIERVTFLLAMLGYAGLTFTAARATTAPLPRTVWRVVVLIIVAHVLLVWGTRYEWQFTEATRNGYTGFLVFHVALLTIVASVFAPEHLARGLVWGAFVVVSIGAIGATFRYDVVAAYRIPVLLCAAVGLGSLTMAVRRRRRSR